MFYRIDALDTMFYRIDALDTLFFRNAAPFEAGTNHSAISLFPPLPSVYAGALRSCAAPIPAEIAGRQTVSRQMWVGYSGLMQNREFLFPAPLDSRLESDGRLHPYKLAAAGIDSYPLPFRLTADRAGAGKNTWAEGGYLEEDVLKNYLSGMDEGMAYVQPAIGHETHSGIKLDKSSRTTEDKYLYQLRVVRLSNNTNQCSLVIEAGGISLPEAALIRLGGESKTARLSRLEKTIGISPLQDDDSGYFKLYFATPSIFKNGWLPWWIDRRDMTGVFAYKKRRVRVRLLCAAVGRFVPTGGFGTSGGSGRPREMRYAVPAGSVYFFKLLEGGMETVNKLFHGKCLSDYRESQGFVYQNIDRMRYCDRGFGYCLTGNLSEEQLKGVMGACTK